MYIVDKTLYCKTYFSLSELLFEVYLKFVLYFIIPQSVNYIVLLLHSSLPTVQTIDIKNFLYCLSKDFGVRDESSTPF